VRRSPPRRSPRPWASARTRSWAPALAVVMQPEKRDFLFLASDEVEPRIGASIDCQPAVARADDVVSRAQRAVVRGYERSAGRNRADTPRGRSWR
jgi:hypothetical protein